MASLMRLLFDTMPLGGAREALELVVASYEYASLADLKVMLTPLEPTETAKMQAKLPPLSVFEENRHVSARSVWSFDGSQSLHSFENIEARSKSENFRNCRVLDSVSFGLDAEQGFEPGSIEVTLLDSTTVKLPLTADALVMNVLCRDGIATPVSQTAWPVTAVHEYGALRVFVYEVDEVSGEVILAKDIHDPEFEVFRESVQRLRQGSPTAPDELVESVLVDNFWNPASISEVSAVVVDPADGLAAAVAAGDQATIEQYRQALMKQAEDLGLAVPWWYAESIISSYLPVVSGRPHRIVVCEFLSLHKAGDDYTPGRPATGARLYPVIMLQSTHELSSMRAALKFTRPALTTIDGEPAAQCHCSEMNAELDTLLVSDANEGDSKDFRLPWWTDPVTASPFAWALGLPKLNGLPGAPPLPLWDVIFAYVLANPLKSVAGRRLPVVYRADSGHGRGKRTLNSAVTFQNGASWSSVRDITREPRQGAFDNIHVAPSMRMPEITEVFQSVGPTMNRRSLTEADREAWHFDEVAMAPICAHNCFHMHWRWSASVQSSTDDTARGWDGEGSTGAPYKKAGASLIPKNQDLFLRLVDKTTFVYEAEVAQPRAGEWQYICHHGAGYVLETGWEVDAGRLTQDGFAGLGLIPTFIGKQEAEASPNTWDLASVLVGVPAIADNLLTPHGQPVTASENWSVFYWRNRYTLATDADSIFPVERVGIRDLEQVINETYLK
jgi:hypothetical protein